MTIRYAGWSAEGRARRINKAIDLFGKKYPKIRVKADFRSYTDFRKKFNTQVPGGNSSDMFRNAIGYRANTTRGMCRPAPVSR
ncbi:hypothetical protein ABTX34_10770 [Streptomyces sp. NPDC096538]|uniref:hypothetical protein n=1 Tax=Streptomyces sp. NPDC096538 TaxID=3155427 RepID=UPI0033195F3D